jgi:hypothetical protein
MPDSNPFSAKLAEVRTAMEREEWARAIKTMENIGPIPEKFQTVASNILFFLYISRNEFAKLARICGQFTPQRSKDTLSALLLLRDKALEYPLQLPANWSLEAWEKAVEAHARAGALEPKEIRLCLFFLALLNRPALLEMLHFMGLASGEDLDDEVVAIVVRCLVRHRKFAEARRFLWTNNSRNIGFTRFSFLIDRAEKGETAVPESDDKFLRFLRHRFGANLPTPSPTSA